MKVTKSDGTVVENVYDVDSVLVRTTVSSPASDGGCRVGARLVRVTRDLGDLVRGQPGVQG